MTIEITPSYASAPLALTVADDTFLAGVVTGTCADTGRTIQIDLDDCHQVAVVDYDTEPVAETVVRRPVANSWTLGA